MFKVNNKNTDFFIVNFEHISHLFLVFLLLTLNKSVLAGYWDDSEDELKRCVAMKQSFNFYSGYIESSSVKFYSYSITLSHILHRNLVKMLRYHFENFICRSYHTQALLY